MTTEERYREEHVFPSGLVVGYETDPVEEYMAARDAIKSDEDLMKFQEFWRYLFPEIVFPGLEAKVLDSLKNSEDIQKEFLDKAVKGDKRCSAYMNVLIPPRLIQIFSIAEKFGVRSGLAFMQLWNGGHLEEHEDGTWIAVKAKKEDK